MLAVILILILFLVVGVGVGVAYKYKDKLRPKKSSKKSGSTTKTSSSPSPATNGSTNVGNRSETEPCRTGEWANEGACVNGKQKQTRSVTGDCAEDILGEKEIDCCSMGEWTNEGPCRRVVGSEFPDTVSQKQVRTLTGTCASHEKKVREIPCCLVDLDWKDVTRCTFGNKKVQKRNLAGTCPVEDWETVRDVDCSFSDPPNCADTDKDTGCVYWARAKHCDNTEHWRWMLENCATSCQRTGPVELGYTPKTCKAPDAATFCIDNYTDCEERKAKGECDTNPHAQVNCRKTCEVWGCQSTRFGTHKPDDNVWSDNGDQAKKYQYYAKGVESLLPNWCMDRNAGCYILDRMGYDGPGKDTVKPGVYTGNTWTSELNPANINI